MASKMASKARPATRHVISINDLSDKDIETIFDTAQSYLKQLPDPHFPYRIGRSTNVASNYILASLFYEPSTRTRLSFESAMIRLGGQTITSADPATSSAAKGESLADTVRVIANYADIMVIRHPRDGAARLAAEYSPIPVINGGDGSHEHPTQTLCDLFTLKQKNKRLKNLKVAISGDLKGSRTIHSFVYALARFGATIMPMPAKGMELPAHVDQRLREEFRCHMVPVPKGDGDDASIDALYVTPEEPHQQSLFSGPEIERDTGRDLGMVDKKVDALYVTRFQKERWVDKDQAYPRIDRKFLNEPKYSDASVMHPLPRVGELDAAFDTDRRAVYFEQAAYGVPIRMALISLLLGTQGQVAAPLRRRLRARRQHRVRSAAQRRASTASIRTASCTTRWKRSTCATSSMSCSPATATRLRCVYCEREIDHFVVASKKNKWYAADPSALARSNRPRPEGHRSVRRRSRCAGGRLPFPPCRCGAAAGATGRRALQDVAPADARRCRRLVAACLRRRRLSVRLSLRLDPVRRGPDAARRHAGHPHRRLRQYRRHQCAAHRPQGAGRGDPARRHAQGHGRGAVALVLVQSRPASRAAAGLGAFLGHLFPVWLRFKGGKGVATYIGILLGLAWPAALAFCAIWLAVAARHPLLVAGRADRQRRDAGGAAGDDVGPRAGAVRPADGHPVDHASRQYRAAAPGHRRQDRAEGKAAPGG